MIFDRYRFNEQLAMDLGEKILLALIALVVTWLAARAAKWAFAKLVDTVDFFRRGTGNGQSLGESLGKIVSLLIWLFGLLVILNILDLGGERAQFSSNDGKLRPVRRQWWRSRSGKSAIVSARLAPRLPGEIDSGSDSRRSSASVAPSDAPS